MIQNGNGDLVGESIPRLPVGDKQKDAIKGGMGRFSNMIKSASKGIQLKKKVDEPAEFPEPDVLLFPSIHCRRRISHQE